MKCPLGYRCKCKARVGIIAGKDYKLLEFFGTHDENSHADVTPWAGKKLKHLVLDES